MSRGESGSAMALHKSKRNSVSFTAAKGRSTISAHKTKQEKKKRGPMGSKTRCCTWAVGRSPKKSSLEKREKKKMKARVTEMEAFVSDMRTQVDSERRLLLEGEATVEEFKALVAQKREENKLHFMMILRAELLADHIQFNILP
ncbi:PREDICTED: uncharacterized protein LOC18599244 isoform X1 [Theobroma cacao]|uniref:Uncharacterized protein LOC18599244 isoform X1 n=1 Tax=Theobroma cacao TaxID=3641 RepID=A0AB32V4T9_THECC|nr:PREDICTED: uncharacterized protein LOC18599244 isoform X1 [Theobroma cacao]